MQNYIKNKQNGIKEMSNLQVLVEAIKISLKTKSFFSIIIGILGFGMTFYPLVLAEQLNVLTNYVQRAYGASKYEIKETYYVLIALVGLFIFRVIFNFFQDFSNEKDILRIYGFIKEKILLNKCEVKYKYIDNYDNYIKKLALVNDESGLRVANSIQTLITIIQAMVTFLVITWRLWNVTPLLVVIVIASSIPAAILSFLQKDENFKARTKWLEDGQLVIHYFFICSDLPAMKDVRHYNILDYLKTKWRIYGKEYCKKKSEIIKKHLKYNLAADMLTNIVYIFILIILVMQIKQDTTLGLGMFTLVISLTSSMQNATNIIMTKMIMFICDIPYMRDFFELENLEKDTSTEKTEIVHGDIIVKNLYFKYPGNNNYTLKNINVQIKEGEKIAIVGENGSGKSTFINLLCGMYEIEEGSIYVAGENIVLNMEKIRNSISAVFQDFGRYDGTIRENITVSDLTLQKNDNDILDIAQKINYIDIIQSQENGLDEKVGVFSDKSNDFSGGQWQKIAILRALYRDKASILILDEPTAALDPMAECELYSEFSQLTKDKTTILISHRLGVASVVDRILVFRDGAIVEEGSHDELMQRGGYYSELYQAQAKWYQ